MREAWTALAAQLGGRYEPPSGPWYRRGSDRVVATIDGQEIVLDHYTVSNGKTARIYTRLRTRVPGGASPELRLGREGLLASLGRALGGQDLEIGDRDFDATFRVRGDDEPFVAAWLGVVDRARLLAASDYEYVVEHGELTMHRRELELDPVAAALAMRAAAALCRGGRELLAMWARVADALEARLYSDGATFVPGHVRIEVGDGVPVVIESRSRDTRVRADLPRVSATRWNVSPDEPLPPTVTRSASEAWGALGAAGCGCDGASVYAVWPGHLLTPTRARRGVELVRALVPEAGLYR